jgi:hypothetical protein
MACVHAQHDTGIDRLDVQVFGNCTQILPDAAVEGQLAHLDFYLSSVYEEAWLAKPLQLFTDDGKVEILGCGATSMLMLKLIGGAVLRLRW